MTTQELTGNGRESAQEQRPEVTTEPVGDLQVG